MADDWMDRTNGWLNRVSQWLDPTKRAKLWKNPSWGHPFVVLPWLLGVVLAISEWTTHRKIASRERTAVGTITAHEPANHNRYGCTFFVDGKIYSGWQSPLREEPVVGREVLVYYDPLNAEENALTDYGELSVADLGPVPLLLIGVGTVAVIIACRRRHFRIEESLGNQ